MKTMMMTVWQDLYQCHLEDILAMITDPYVIKNKWIVKK